MENQNNKIEEINKQQEELKEALSQIDTLSGQINQFLGNVNSLTEQNDKFNPESMQNAFTAIKSLKIGKKISLIFLIFISVIASIDIFKYNDYTLLYNILPYWGILSGGVAVSGWIRKWKDKI